jgi:hypothetical protein
VFGTYFVRALDAAGGGRGSNTGASAGARAAGA